MQDAPELNDLLEHEPVEHPRMVTRFAQATLRRSTSPCSGDANGEKGGTARGGVETPADTPVETPMETDAETPAETTVFEAVTRRGLGRGSAWAGVVVDAHSCVPG